MNVTADRLARFSLGNDSQPSFNSNTNNCIYGNSLAQEGDIPPSPAPSSPGFRRQYSVETELVYTELNDQYKSSSMPLYQTATFKQDSMSNMGEYDYSRSGNPTRTHLERHLTRIIGGAVRCLAVSSGMTALDVITRLLKPGDEVIAGDDLYGGTNRLLKYLGEHAGIIAHHVDTANIDAVKSVISSKTTMVLLESPTNPLIKIVNVVELSRLVHTTAPDALVVVDNTMLSPVLMSPLQLGADIVYESGTKYISGHHDVMAGVISVRSDNLGNRLFFIINASGCGLAPFECWLLERGLKTLSIRMSKQQENAQVIAEFLQNSGFKVRYPGLSSHPQYDLHWQQATGAGAVLAFETGSVDLSERIVESCRLWGISVSFGCVNSLISMPCKMSHASIDSKTRALRKLPEDLIRLCVGIENVDDLLDDLTTALVKARAVKIHVNGSLSKLAI